MACKNLWPQPSVISNGYLAQLPDIMLTRPKSRDKISRNSRTNI